MKKYIEHWLRKALVKIPKTNQQEVGNIVKPTPTQNPIKET